MTVTRRTVCKECADQRQPGAWDQGLLLPIRRRGICYFCKTMKRLKVMREVRK